VPRSIVRQPLPFEQCLPPRSWGLVLLRAKLLCKQYYSINDCDKWNLILCTYQALGAGKPDDNEMFAEPVTSLCLLHRCRLKLIIRWLRKGLSPSVGMVKVLETFSYKAEEVHSDTSGLYSDPKRNVLRLLNDCAAAFEYCIGISPYHHRSVKYINKHA
jgi:hypothetical protein